MQDLVSGIEERLKPAGLVVLGVFQPLADGPHNGVMIGNVGSDMWSVFAEWYRTDVSGADGSDPLDKWTRQVLIPVAEELGAEFLHPSDGPPWHPFPRWARACGSLFASPLGLNIHPEFGLWTALRGVIILPHAVSMPVLAVDSPCDQCVTRPCLSACPVGAFRVDTYAVQDCRDELAGPDRAACMTGACAARRACPIGTRWQYDTDHATFHMQAFRAGILPSPKPSPVG